jgi:hypothetical protein
MTAPGSYATETSDMIAVHQDLMGALQAAPSLVGSAGDSSDRADLIGSYCENVLELLHVHHAGEDELTYPILEERLVEDNAMLERVGAQHSLLHEPMGRARTAIAAWRANPSVEGGQPWPVSSRRSTKHSGLTSRKKRARHYPSPVRG